MRSFALCFSFFATFLTATLFAQNASSHFPGEITVAVDASEATGRLFHSRLTLPVHPGQLTLLYPKWMPGEHGPTGPVVDFTGLKLFANGQRLPWRRDDVDM